MVQSCGQRKDKKGFLNFGPKTGKNCGQFCYKIGKKLWSKNYSRICVKFWSNLLSKIWSAILGQNIGLKRVQNLVKIFYLQRICGKFCQNLCQIFFSKFWEKSWSTFCYKLLIQIWLKFFFQKSSKNVVKKFCVQVVAKMLVQ